MAHLHKNIIKFHHQFILFVHPLGEMGFLFCGQKMIPQKTAETLIKEENDLFFAQPIVGIGSGVCSLSKVAYSLAKTMDFCQLFCGFEPTLGNLLNPLYHGPRQMAKWQRKNI
jgi:hypothetical protein